VSGSFERFLIGHGERVVRVATKLMSDARRAGRERGKSDRIDALAVARAALREPCRLCHEDATRSWRSDTRGRHDDG